MKNMLSWPNAYAVNVWIPMLKNIFSIILALPFITHIKIWGGVLFLKPGFGTVCKN